MLKQEKQANLVDLLFLLQMTFTSCLSLLYCDLLWSVSLHLPPFHLSSSGSPEMIVKTTAATAFPVFVLKIRYNFVHEREEVLEMFYFYGLKHAVEILCKECRRLYDLSSGNQVKRASCYNLHRNAVDYKEFRIKCAVSQKKADKLVVWREKINEMPGKDWVMMMIMVQRSTQDTCEIWGRWEKDQEACKTCSL